MNNRFWAHATILFAAGVLVTSVCSGELSPLEKQNIQLRAQVHTISNKAHQKRTAASQKAQAEAVLGKNPTLHDIYNPQGVQQNNCDCHMAGANPKDFVYNSEHQRVFDTKRKCACQGAKKIPNSINPDVALPSNPVSNLSTPSSDDNNTDNTQPGFHIHYN